MPGEKIHGKLVNMRTMNHATQLYEQKQFKQLKQLLSKDGYLHLQHVIPQDVARAAREKLIQHLDKIDSTSARAKIENGTANGSKKTSQSFTIDPKDGR
jgi:spermidine synthase